MIQLILIAVLGVAALWGAISGLVKGYAKTSFFGGTVIFAVLLERLIGGGVKKDSSFFGIAVIIAAIASILVFSALFASARKFIGRRIAERRTLSEYRNHDALEENETLILNALDNDDKKEYKKLRKERKKIKTKNGAWGIVNRVLGALSGALNALVGAFVFVAIVVLFVDLTQISLLVNLFGEFIASSLWADALGTIAMDTILVAVVASVVRSGYKNGISSLASTLIIIGLIVVFAIASWNLASSEAMSGMVNGLEEGIFGILPDFIANFLEGMKHNIAIIITTVIFFLLSLILVIIVGIFLPRLVAKFSENKVMCAVDGVFGAIIFTAFIIALVLAFGGIAYTLGDLPVMANVNKYMDKSFLADCTYSCNPLESVFANLPLRGLFGGAAN